MLGVSPALEVVVCCFGNLFLLLSCGPFERKGMREFFMIHFFVERFVGGGLVKNEKLAFGRNELVFLNIDTKFVNWEAWMMCRSFKYIKLVR